jgi:hypothetical protein
VKRRSEWMDAGRQYGLLLGKLPGL